MPRCVVGLDLAVEHLDVEAQARERRAQVVRDAGEEGGALALGAAQVLLHLVEGARHRADLGRARSPATGGGSPPRPSCRRGARELAAAGGSGASTMRKVARIAIARPATPQATSAVAGSRSMRPRGNATQNSRSPAGSVTQSTRGRRALGSSASPLAHVDLGVGRRRSRACARGRARSGGTSGAGRMRSRAAHRRDADAFLLGDARDEGLAAARGACVCSAALMVFRWLTNWRDARAPCAGGSRTR